MKVSIIMPIYNAEDYLKRSIDSVLTQSYENIELILVNDGSTDSSLDICKGYEANDKRVLLLDIKNSGPGAARNNGLNRVTGDYITFVDADDFLKIDAIETLMLIAVKNDYDIVSSNHFRVDGEITVSKNNYKTGEISRKKTQEQCERYNLFKTSSSFGYVWGKIYKTSFIKDNDIKFSEERKVFLEDTLLNLKAFSYNPRYYVLNEPLYYYSILEDSISNKKEDITDRAIKVLEDYEAFLDQKNIYDENLDLFIALASRTISWSLFKTMDNEFKLDILYGRILKLSKNNTIRRLFFCKDSLTELKKINSIIQVFAYSFIVLCIKYKLVKVLTVFFYVSYPLLKIYIKSSLKK